MSMRSPLASDPPIYSSNNFTAMSTASAFRGPWRWVRISISSDLVMDTVIVVSGRSVARPKPGHRSTAYSDLFSSYSRSSAPSLVVPLEASEDDDALLYSATVSAVSASSLALIDSCSEHIGTDPSRERELQYVSISVGAYTSQQTQYNQEQYIYL